MNKGDVIEWTVFVFSKAVVVVGGTTLIFGFFFRDAKFYLFFLKFSYGHYFCLKFALQNLFDNLSTPILLELCGTIKTLSNPAADFLNRVFSCFS